MRKNCIDSEGNSKPGELCDELTDLERFTEVGFKMLMETTKKSNKLPFGRARDLYESFPSFLGLMKIQGESVLSILTKILQHKGRFQKMDDEDKFEMIIDANDALLENVGISFEELSDVKKHSEPKYFEKKRNHFNGSWNRRSSVDTKSNTQVLNVILSNTKNIEKPQLHFLDKVDNNPNIPFEPKIKYKYNMLKPLALLPEEDEDGKCQFSHPYEFELLKFKPSNELLTTQTVKPFKSLEETPFYFISSSKEIDFMIKDLEKYKELSVDLEHHSYRSFQGFTCLMQISTRDTDYVIDTIKLRSELQILNKIFTDSSIVKVFHGADSDIMWLQKDLGVYVVNMFDTHQAAKLLNFPKLSLAYLLLHYCGVKAKKHFQLADWRIRPIPDDLLTYAREDTHYLLYIYDNLRNALLEKVHGQTNLVEAVISESTAICLKRYTKPPYETDGYLDIYQRSKKLFDNRQKFALEHLFKWRDATARELDESYGYVLPNHMMLNISEVLPREAQGILACCNPIPIPVRQNLLKLHQIILKAREQPLIKPVLEEQKLYKYTTAINSLDNPLQCPHDLNHESEFRDDLTVLFSTKNEKNLGRTCPLKTLCTTSKPIVDLFDKPTAFVREVKLSRKMIPPSPYARYKLAKKFLENAEAKKLFKIGEDDFEKGSQPSSQFEDCDINQRKITPFTPSELQEGESISSENDKELINENVRCNETEKYACLQKTESKRNDGVNFNHTKKSCRDTQENLKKLRGRKDTQNLKNKNIVKYKQPFDYKSIDFDKYCTASVSKTNKSNEKQQKKSKKKFKISV